MMMTGFRWCWLFLCTCIKSVTNTSNLSPTHFVSNIYYQNRYNSLIQVEHTQTDRRRYDRQRRTTSLTDEYTELLGQKLVWKHFAKPLYHTESIMLFEYSIKWVTETTYSCSKSQKYSNPLSLSHFKFTLREMIALFLLIFAFQNALAEEVNLRQLVNSLQMNMNEMSSKMTTFETKVQSLENEIKVGVDLKNWKLNKK